MIYTHYLATTGWNRKNVKPRFSANAHIGEPLEKLNDWMQTQPRWGIAVQDTVLTPVFQTLSQEIKNCKTQLEPILRPLIAQVSAQAGSSSNPMRLAFALHQALQGEMASNRSFGERILAACQPALEKAAKALETATLTNNMPPELHVLVKSVAAEMRGANSAMPKSSALRYLAPEDLLEAVGAPVIRIQF